jgi:hypothetical protein
MSDFVHRPAFTLALLPMRGDVVFFRKTDWKWGWIQNR